MVAFTHFGHYFRLPTVIFFFFLLCSLPRSACSLHNLATNMTFLQELLVHNELAAVCLIISGAKSPRLKYLTFTALFFPANYFTAFVRVVFARV